MPKTILIVDDFESSRNILGRTLEYAGYTVLHGSDGENAMVQLNGTRIDLIITDLNMPGMDGISLIKSLRKTINYKFTPVILLSTNAKSDKQEQAKQAGATAFVEKPFQVEALLESVKKMIR
ncbi:MAG: response regulator [Bacteroidota bacterium]|nr:response regulator [Bacteroidota bacterium]